MPDSNLSDLQRQLRDALAGQLIDISSMMQMPRAQHPLSAGQIERMTRTLSTLEPDAALLVRFHGMVLSCITDADGTTDGASDRMSGLLRDGAFSEAEVVQLLRFIDFLDHMSEDTTNILERHLIACSMVRHTPSRENTNVSADENPIDRAARDFQ